MSSCQSGARSTEIDSLRALAMIAVVAIHAKLLPVGWIGVWLFYVISGYVVTQSVLNRKASDAENEGFGTFMHRRAVRILPLYFAYLLIGSVVASLNGQTLSLNAIASLAFFYNNVAVVDGGGRIAGWPTGHLWTLSVEMQFYLIYGAVLCFMSPRVTKGILIAFIIAAPISRALVGWWLSASQMPSLDAAYAVYVAPGLHFDVFAMGALLAFLQHQKRLSEAAVPLALYGMALLAIYVAAYAAVNVMVRDARGLDIARDIVSGILFGEGRHIFLYSALGAAMAGLVSLAVVSHPLVTPLLSWQPLARLGEISYGGYVYHQLGLGTATMILETVGIAVRGGGMSAHLLQFMIGMIITTVLAWMSFTYFETPARRWLTRRKSPQLALNQRSSEAAS